MNAKKDARALLDRHGPPPGDHHAVPIIITDPAATSKSRLIRLRSTCGFGEIEKMDVYCYFDNDERGYAAINADELQKMIGD